MEILKKIFSIKRCGMNRVFIIFGLKIKLPINTCCSLPDLSVLHKKNIDFPHPIGIVIAENVKLGNNCVIYQNVTIGGKTRIGKNGFPTIGDNVTIYAGACIIGDVKIGNNVIIGANAVVTKDIPNNCVVAGVPAKVIKKI